MTSKFINRIRWKIYWHEKKQNTDLVASESDSTTIDQLNPNNNKNIFPSKRSAPISRKILGFENDLFDLCKNLKFKKSNSKYQNEIKKTINELKEKRKIIVKADKTSNIYEVDSTTKH